MLDNRFIFNTKYHSLKIQAISPWWKREDSQNKRRRAWCCSLRQHDEALHKQLRDIKSLKKKRIPPQLDLLELTRWSIETAAWENTSQIRLDYSASENARTEARNDLFFSRVSQWDDWLENYVTLQYRGQFDVVRPWCKLVAEMRKNPIEVQYRPKDNAPADAADILWACIESTCETIAQDCR